MNVSNPSNLLIKILVEKSMNQSASNSNFESTFARAKLRTKLIIQTDLTMNRTIPFNSETFMRIRSRKKSEKIRNFGRTSETIYWTISCFVNDSMIDYCFVVDSMVDHRSFHRIFCFTSDLLICGTAISRKTCATFF